MSYHYPVLFVVLGLRLWELYYSWRRLAEDRRAAQAEPVSEPIFPAMVAVHSAWLVGCLVEVAVRHPQFHAWLVLPMLLLWALALGLRFWVILSMGPCWNVRLIKRKKQPVVTSGPYRYIRHPLYSFATLCLLGVGMAIDNGSFIVFPLGAFTLMAIRVPREEALLVEKFGDAYREYRSRTGRFLPRLRGRVGSGRVGAAIG